MLLRTECSNLDLNIQQQKCVLCGSQRHRKLLYYK
jgi:hypothetical protein